MYNIRKMWEYPGVMEMLRRHEAVDVTGASQDARDGAPDVAADPTTARRLRPSTVAFIVLAVAALAAELWFAAPYIGEAADAVSDANLGWLVIALAAEVSSTMAFARLQRVILRGAGIPVRLPDAVGTVYAGNAMTVTLPGGSLASFAYSVRRMRSWGASTPLAVFSLIATGALSTLALITLGVAGFLLSGNIGGIAGALAEAVVVVVVAAAVLKILGDPRVASRLVYRVLRIWARLRPHSETPSRRAVTEAVMDLSRQRPSRTTWLRGITFATLKWSADIFCLYATCRAIGVEPGLSTLLLAYAAGMAAASTLPLLPGGIGFVEPALILVLIHGHLPAAAATAAVLVYRCINLGMVASAGWVVLILQRSRSRWTRTPVVPVVPAVADVTPLN